MNQFETQLVKEAREIAPRKPLLSEGKVAWKSPSNIAIVKYWGKRPGQIPANASLSITLSKALTETSIAFTYDPLRKKPQLNFRFEGAPQNVFEKRIEKYLASLDLFFPWLVHCQLDIDSQNTFPHSSGIASSASAMSALALGLCEIEEKIYGEGISEDFFRKASFMARLGSGSASRSLFGNMAVWGFSACMADSSDEYAVPVPEMHPDMVGMKDSILIIESGKKNVPSSVGHDLMKSNPYARLRFEVAEENMRQLCSIVKRGELDDFIALMENEALSLHAMMMTSEPGFLLMRPNTVAAIEKIRDFRNTSKLAVGFTIDAGANLHVLYTKSDDKKVKTFIDSELKKFCEKGIVIHDEMGRGPAKV